MAGTYAFSITMLALIWCVLSESFALLTVAVGILTGTGCALFSHAFLPLYKAGGVSVLKLVTYPLFLLAQMYISAIGIIRMIFTKSKADIIEVENKIEGEFLQFLLSHSITLTPGTITLDMTEDKVTVLCLRKCDATSQKAKTAVEKLERRLLLAQKTESGK